MEFNVMKSIKKILMQDFKRIYPQDLKIILRIKYIINSDITYKRWKYIKYMRKSNDLEYNRNIINNIKKIYYDKKKNKLGMMLGYEIFSNEIGEGLCLYHNGPIVINKNAKLGCNCSLHGDNCIGNDGS